jgi:uncharacterized protein (TIGR03067 family)
MSRQSPLAALLLAALAIPLFAAAPPSRAGKGVPELQGTWKLEAIDAEAGPVGLSDPSPTLVIRGDRLRYGDQEIARVWADPTCTPRNIDLHFPDPKRVYEGIYAIEKDKLKVCLNGRTDGVKERPLSFAIKDRPTWRLLSFHRARPGETAGGNGFVGLALKFDAGATEVVIQDVLARGPARKAGLRKGDVLVEVAGEAITDLRSRASPWPCASGEPARRARLQSPLGCCRSTSSRGWDEATDVGKKARGSALPRDYRVTNLGSPWSRSCLR